MSVLTFDRVPSRFRERPRWLLPLVGVLAVLLVVEALGVLLPGPSGPPSSSYATASEGVAAYAELLQRERHSLSRVRGRLDATPLDPGSTLVILGPDVIVAPEARALRRFVAGGGRLVVGARHPGTWLGEVMDRPPAWTSDGPRDAAPVGSASELAGAGVQHVRASGQGAWRETGAARPLLSGPGGTLGVERAAGRGKILLLADPAPLQNRLLGQADDAALGVALAGEPARPVAFLESVHGYGRGRGLGALPDRWQWALGGLLLATLMWLAAHARRLGPPELEGRELPPARRVYVDAIAALLARTGRLPEASAGVAAAARERLLRRAALPPDASEEAVARAAERFGLSPEEAQALGGAPQSESEARAAGRALARLEGGRG